MKNAILLLILIVSCTLSLQAQEDLALFDYWKYYSDAENTMYKHFSEKAFTHLVQRKEQIATLSTKADWENRQQWVKEKLMDLLGPLPEKTPLNAKITGTVDREDFRVEKILFESTPSYYVTAGLFIPKNRKGKTPAIVYASGHTTEGFRSETYQHIIINLVKKGFIVLAFDPVGQGERFQYFDTETGKTRFGPTKEHSFPGAQCYIAGYSPTRYFVWDAMRAIDYLLTRPEVDPEKIGMTGRSGGGTQTAYTAAIDDRILAAAPECFITSMEYILKTIGPQDAEQNLTRMLVEGLDHADLLTVRAPKPTMMITTTRDFFSIQGARETFAEVKMAYEKMAAGKAIGMVEDDEGHASTPKNREAMYAFFQKNLGLAGDPTDIDVEVFDKETLWVTKTGQLATSQPGETLFSLNKKLVDNLQVNLQQQRKQAQHLARVRTNLASQAGIVLPKEGRKLIFSGRYVKETFLLEKYMLTGNGGEMLPGALYIPTANQATKLVLLLTENGLTDNPKALLHKLLEDGYAVLRIDLPGTGALGPGYLKGDAYIDGVSLNQWFAGILVGESVVGLRASVILQWVQAMKTHQQAYQQISAISTGTLGSELLHAAVLDEDINQVFLWSPMLSYAALAAHRDYPTSWIYSTVSGALTTYDLPDLMAALAPRKLWVLNPQLTSEEKVSQSVAAPYLNYPKAVFAAQQKSPSFKLVIEEQEDLLLKELMNGLKE